MAGGSFGEMIANLLGFGQPSNNSQGSKQNAAPKSQPTQRYTTPFEAKAAGLKFEAPKKQAFTSAPSRTQISSFKPEPVDFRPLFEPYKSSYSNANNFGFSNFGGVSSPSSSVGTTSFDSKDEEETQSAESDNAYKKKTENQRTNPMTGQPMNNAPGQSEETQDEGSFDTGIESIFSKFSSNTSNADAQNSKPKKDLAGLSSSELFDVFKSETGYGDYDNFSDFQFAGDNSDSWLDYMKFGYDRAGMYEDIEDALGEGFFDYDASDPEQLAAAREAYANWYNPWVNEHTIDDIMFGNIEEAAPIIGGYSADADALANWITSQGHTIASAGYDYQPIFDENGNITGVTNQDQILSTEAEDYYDTIRNMLGLYAMAGDANNYITTDKSQNDNRFSYNGEPLDFGNIGATIPGGGGSVYGYSGGDAVTEDQLNALLSADLSDWKYYRDNPNFVPMAAIALGALSGQGSALADDTWTPEEWESFYNNFVAV